MRRLACFFESTPLDAALRIALSALRRAVPVSSPDAVRTALTAVLRPLEMWRLRARRFSLWRARFFAALSR
jgi:hypothetical protein